jgi:hypothetical protein
MSRKIFLFSIGGLLMVVTVFHGLLVTGILSSAWNPYTTDSQTVAPIDTQDVPGESYTACGCGCCSGLQLKPEEQCIYHANGDDLQNIIDLDRVAAQNPNCATQGCSFGKKYLYCD